ncbi:MAG TPA: hypothetical protein VN673_06140, partial [Clostridia bacterium]|nr:hypothetical protein [Clostridia bacterium]
CGQSANNKAAYMKNTIFGISLFLLVAMLLCSGCVGLSVGGGTKTETQKATVGQQLIDLQKARDTGALTEAEYQVQRAKVLQQH